MLGFVLFLLVAFGMFWWAGVYLAGLWRVDKPIRAAARGAKRSGHGSVPIPRSSFADKPLSRAERELWARIEAHWSDGDGVRA
jgi:hypothetical protein